jgi:hypothetical protein
VPGNSGDGTVLSWPGRVIQAVNRAVRPDQASGRELLLYFPTYAAVGWIVTAAANVAGCFAKSSFYRFHGMTLTANFYTEDAIDGWISGLAVATFVVL